MSSTSFEVIVVDNNSTDNSVSLIRRNFPRVRLIESEVNLGFGGANNEGAKKAKGSYLFFLNPDTLVPKGALKKIIEFTEKHPEIGIFTPKLVCKDHKTVQSGIIGYRPTIERLILEKPFKLFSSPVRRIALLNAVAKRVSLDFWDFNQEREVDWVTGAAMVVSKALFDKLQGFDEKIFMYFEDVDFCLRAKELGAKIFYYPGVSIIHLGGRSIHFNRERKKIYYQSQNYFWAKHHSLFSTIVFKIIRFPYLLFSLFFTGDRG